MLVNRRCDPGLQEAIGLDAWGYDTSSLRTHLVGDQSPRSSPISVTGVLPLLVEGLCLYDSWRAYIPLTCLVVGMKRLTTFPFKSGAVGPRNIACLLKPCHE